MGVVLRLLINDTEYQDRDIHEITVPEETRVKELLAKFVGRNIPVIYVVNGKVVSKDHIVSDGDNVVIASVVGGG